ncbi:GFA family protein [Aurantiacibacter sp. MUD11]|uniref:GFA family protein n=1 Tax=Aurantiacibacter sp. MUD11 TaxID=3003265 RepID=UPI0022AA6FA4|nr:GFA family protein [Aurantiacibacter sp. MUD11]WAT18645.1 GFA family protein [Aurantiacibacter sp. MUD11]
MKRKGSCHCGAVRFEAEFADERLVPSRCNCSICAMKGAAMVYLPVGAVTVTKGEDALSCYRFNTMAAKHHFCSNCGIHVFHQARSDPDKFAINSSTLEGVRPYEDFPEMPVFDGQRHSDDNDGVRRQAGILRFEATPGKVWPDGVI